jgi:sucrose-6-phosphate hydrolase SacC (GH32 family)
MLYFAPKQKKFGDFDLIEVDGRLHCIFIENLKTKRDSHAEIGNSYGLAVSDDGISWNYKGKIMKPDPKTRWKNGSLWAMNVFEENGKFLMMYTAIRKLREDSLPTQQTGLAFSRNLKSWKDSQKRPVISNNQTGSFYHPKHAHKFCWRDPDVHKIDDTYYSLLAAKDITKPYRVSGCVALLKSKDLKKWEVLPPLFSPGKYWEIETPHLYNIRNKWYLIYGEYTNGKCMRYASSNTPLGKFKRFKRNIFTPAYCYAGRITKFNGKHYFYHWIRDRFKGKHETYFSVPKLVEIKEGHLFLKKHDKLDKHFKKSRSLDILSAVKESDDKRARLKKRIKAPYVTINIKTKSPDYFRTVFITKTKSGIAIRDYNINNENNDSRIIPVKIGKSMNLEIFIEDKFLEVYVNKYFVYAAIMASQCGNVQEIEIL